jgi:hypothetical protein
VPWDDERRSFPKCHRNAELNFRGGVTSSISGLDEEIRTSNQHTWRVYLNTKVSHLVLFASSVALVAMIKTYETTDMIAIFDNVGWTERAHNPFLAWDFE